MRSRTQGVYQPTITAGRRSTRRCRRATCARAPCSYTASRGLWWGSTGPSSGPEAYLRSRQVEVVVLDDPDCLRLMTRFIAEHPDLWNEDIGE